VHGASPLPTTGETFLDARGSGRALRISWHPEDDVIVLSIWRSGICAGTFRLPVQDVPELIDVLRAGLAAAYDDAHDSLIPGMPALHEPDRVGSA
jgi:hypothetical protein